MSRLSLKNGSKLPYWVTFVIDKFAISKLLPEFFRKTYADLPKSVA